MNKTLKYTILSHKMASIKVTLDAALVSVMADYTDKILTDAIQRLSEKFGFDPDEAKTFLASGGIVVKYPPLEREKLPWTGNVRPECCKAIKKNGGLFTQCFGAIHADEWCKPCAKEVAKKGKPSCGTVQERLDTDVLEYKVGPFKVKPYVDYMKKHAIAREQVDQACDAYEITIDPRQFEVKKRPRKTRDMAAAIDAQAPIFDESQVDDAVSTFSGYEDGEEIESEEEYDFVPPTITHPLIYNVTTAPTLNTNETPVVAPAPAVAELIAEPLVTALPTTALPPTANITIESISGMDKKTVIAHCNARGIDSNSKGLVQLKRELSASIKNPVNN
jgi:hypothetical protein